VRAIEVNQRRYLWCASFLRKTGKLLILGVLLSGAFYAGTKYGTDRAPSYHPSLGFPRPGQTAVSSLPDDSAARRRELVASDAAAILEQCRVAAGGNWSDWQKRTEPFRFDLRKRIDDLKRLNDQTPLASKDEFPLVEPGAYTHINYLYDPSTLEGFREKRPVVAADRWLRQRRIDLIFVPVPKMTEVYVEHFVDPCPPDGIIAPYVRQTLWELMTAGVEVVDGLRLFRPLREPDPDYLYNTADPHWAPRGMRVMAKEIADRIGRYDFGRRARCRLPIFTTALTPYIIDGHPGGIGDVGWSALSKSQQQLAKSVQTTTMTEVCFWDGQPLTEDSESPVLVVGNSYAIHFREQLALQLNMPIRSHAGHGMGTGAFNDFLREPELLNGIRVVVWITTQQHMIGFKPLPPAILAAAEAGK
jgi:hypothetical protein